ncbi:MAG: o-succinylbenzoate synthase [Chitinophagaceae bacterium]|nr:o-succinylbenzoate synthase [Chitinophagaceae bacterium]MCW5905173.1 o-succinylbenzoate synthase [Chitinophagaceae bacterium]
MRAYFKKYILTFKKPGTTSRGVLLEKPTYFIFLTDGKKTAIGECNLFKNLSYDDKPDYENKLHEIVNRLPNEKEKVLDDIQYYPSIYFGVEMLLKDWNNGAERILFPEVINNNGFLIPTNALIWMGEKSIMKTQIEDKLKDGFTSIKLKIGAIDFDAELDLIKFIRKQFNVNEVEIRLDANGAYTYKDAKEKLQQLAAFDISYIEQPIKAGQWQEMAALTEQTPIPIALDEELIGILDIEKQQQLIDTIKPQMLILKHTLLGGFEACNTWKKLAKNTNASWVITSALESNIGLNAIAQYTALGYSNYVQGLGTGKLYTNNIPSPYTLDNKGLHYHTNKHWDLTSIL